MKRSGPLQRRTPLVAHVPLAAGLPPGRQQPLLVRKGLERGEGLTRSAPMPRSPGGGRSSTPRPRRDGDDRGTPIPRWLADYVVDRAEGCCDWCGRYCLDGWYSRQHRLARGMGGRGGAHTAANLVLLCGSATSQGCHEKAEHSAIPAARDAGFRLRDTDDPELVPILRHGLIRVHPTGDGWVLAA